MSTHGPTQLSRVRPTCSVSHVRRGMSLNHPCHPDGWHGRRSGSDVARGSTPSHGRACFARSTVPPRCRRPNSWQIRDYRLIERHSPVNGVSWNVC